MSDASSEFRTMTSTIDVSSKTDAEALMFHSYRWSAWRTLPSVSVKYDARRSDVMKRQISSAFHAPQLGTAFGTVDIATPPTL